MSTTTSGKRPTTPKKRQTRSQSKGRNQEDVYVRTSLPPFVEGPVYANLICHIPKVRWNTKHQPSCRAVCIKVSWWGEDDTSALFRPQIIGAASSLSQQLSTTAKYYIRSELKQFAKYLIDASDLVLKVFDSESNRLIGTAKVQNLSTLSVNNPIKGFHSIFTSKGDKLGEVFVLLRIYLPGTYDSNENLTTMSVTSDVSNPPSRRSSLGANDYHQNDRLENNSRTYKLDRAYNAENLGTSRSNDGVGKTPRFDTTVPFKPYTSDNQLDGQSHRDQPTGQVVEALIERANRLREDMIRSSSEKNLNNNNSEILTTHEQLESHCNDPENVCDILGIGTSLKLPGDLNNSNDSILTDFDGLENEQSLLEDLLYGAGSGDGASNLITSKQPPRGKPPSGRSRSPSVTRAGRLSHRSRSARSTDSDTASRVSFDMPSSDLDDSGNESHADDENLSTERIQILNHVRTARVRIDQLRLNELNADRQSPSHSSFGRTNKSKRATTYFIEYQFPVIANSRDGQKNEATQVMKIASKRFESNNDIIFSHLSTYPCLFNETILKNWWRSLLIFKIFSRTSGSSSPEQIGFAVLPLRKVLKAESLHLEQNISVIDRTQINQQRLPSKVARKFCIGNLHVLLELDSDVTNFKIELDRLRLIEQMRPKKQASGKTKKGKKKSKQIVVNPNTNLQLPKAFSSEGFMTNEPLSELDDGFVVQIYLSITEARHILQIPNNNHLPRNPYFVCRAFWNEEPITSVVCWGSSSPRFNFEQKIPLLLTKATLDKMHHNFVVIELWDKKISGATDMIIGIVKVPLEQFHISFKDKQISRVLLRAQYPVISTDSWLPIIDPFTSTQKSNGEIQVLLAMGTSDQIINIQVAHANGSLASPASTARKPTAELHPDPSAPSLIEHQFEIMLEGITGLRAFESMVWGESDCFIQYLFPVQQDQDQLTNNNSVKPFQLRPIRTAATLCTSDPTFHDSNKFRYVLSPTDALHKHFYAACHSPSTLETCITFEVWSRFYYPNIRDQLLAKGKLPAAKLCSMTTMLNSGAENKSVQSFRIPLEIVREDPKHGQYHQSSAPAYGGDLLTSVTYRRSIVKKNEQQAFNDRLSSDSAQACISVGIVRACGLKHAAQSQARHDARLNYPAQVGVNTYAKLSLSFLSDTESRTTRTIARSFVPEFNHSIDFPVPLVWNDTRNHTISLAEMLEHGQLKVDLYHQISSTDDSNQPNDKRSLDIHLCYCTIPLKDLLSRHTGIKGWYSLGSANRVATSDVSSDPSEHSVGGLELFIRFGQQDDRRRVIESAKTLGWLDEKYTDEENLLNDQKDLGCLVILSIDRIQFPIQLATRPGKDRVDERTSVFVQYRLYDKMPIITKRKKPIMDKQNVICELKFTKEHLFLCSAPFLWYLREEKLEMQIWTSENDSYDYSSTSAVASTDRHIGSIYVDLNSLCDRKRKSHRLNAVLPMFKLGSKDLGGAFAQVHVTIDKSKDFNELRSRDSGDRPNDAELDSYLENRQLNLIGDDHALRTVTNNVFSVIVNIEQAAHLPNIYSKPENAHTLPNPYVTYSTANSQHLCRTQILTSTNRPIWNYQQAVKLAVEHLFNDKKTFILKVWHKVNADIETIPEKSGDKVLGFVSIDLSPLLSGLQQISGWYNIVDTIGNVQGQLKTSIVPQEDLFVLKRLKYNSNQNKSTPDSYRSTSTNSGTVPPIVFNDLSARSSSAGQTSLNTSMVEDESNKKSFLLNNLHRQLGELGAITDRLKARLNSGTEISSTRHESPSTVTTSRCSSVPPPSTSMQVHVNTHQQNPDSNRSTTTTKIQTDLLEHFPESLSGRPLISDGLNITDVLSHHNDQVRLAQELMTKANHLLESSKDFFNKPPTPPPRSLSIIAEQHSSPSPPPVLPNFNTTTEFHAREQSPPLPPISYQTNEHTHHALDQQHPNCSILWSDEEDNDDHNQTFLPIGLPPTQHRMTTAAITSPRPPSPPRSIQIEEAVPHEEQTDDIDVVHIRPLNNLSAFNFDCQQMNAERLNDTLSPKLTPRRTIFSTHASVDDQYQQISSLASSEHQLKPSSPEVFVERRSFSSSSSSSSSSATPPASPKPQQSFTSDTSVIDKNWLEQQRQRDTNTLTIPPLSLPSDRSATNRSSGRSPHLAFLDRPIPNFFPTNHELEASIKHVSQALSNPNTARTTASPSSPSSTVMKTIIDRLRTKSSNELLRGVSPVDGNLAQPTETTNVTRLEKIFKTKYATNPPSN
ncbi:unnamed protein product [Adineta ricciae]|uniref:C2 domain-containing protein n=1 Tax=Adineta ricciae TaxID=249248 RepID=A0A814S315_ADIRI|nr:unnamed protein product [Adineta ricciae]CAF1169583.1 unnamed protein product [Adineta ricciae]